MAKGRGKSRGAGKRRGQSKTPARAARGGDAIQKAADLFHAGSSREAGLLCRQALIKNEASPAAHYLLGLIDFHEGRLDAAARHLSRATALDRGQAGYFSDLGVVLKQQGRVDEALAAYAEALRLQPDFPEPHNNRGNVLNEQGKYAEALADFDQALASRPDYADAHNNRGLALENLERLDEALAAYARALALKPKFAKAHYNRGNALRKLGRMDQALAAYRRAIENDPQHTPSYNNLGSVLKECGDYDGALAAYRQALTTKPDFADAWYNSANILKEQGAREEALAAYAQALAIKPDYVEARWAHVMGHMAPVYETEAELVHCRGAYEQALAGLIQWFGERSPEETAELWRAVGVAQPFFLPYQGYNDRDLQERYGRLACEVMGQWSHSRESDPPAPAAAATDRFRVGFVSGYVRRHSVWDVFTKGFITQIDRSQFAVYCYHTGWRRDAETRIAESHVDRFVHGPLPIERWLEIIRRDRLDALIYPEIGMDPITVKLAALRLAPVQACAWGHPVTSGLPTMDYFLSGELLEPGDAQRHYTEALVKLPNLGCHFQKIDIEAASVELHHFKITEEADVVRFVSCQQVAKHHPRYDQVYTRIARAVKRCRFFIFEVGRTQGASDRFRQRLERAFRAEGLALEDYCVFLKMMPREEFLGFLHKMDIYLDTITFSGFTTAIQALGCGGLPVVTVNGEFMRARLAAAILRHIGVEETIANDVDEYVAIAVRLASDAAWRDTVRRRILANLPRAYDDRSVVKAFEDFLRRPDQQAAATTAETEALFQRGFADHRAGRLDEAVAAYREVLARQPDYQGAHVNLGSALRRLGRIDEAITHYRKALDLDPRNASAHNNLGNALKTQGKIKEAVRHFKHAIQIHPGYAEAHFNLGIAVQASHRPQEAVKHYEEALRFKPDYAEAHNELGTALQALGKLDAAIQCYQKALQYKPDFSGALNNLGTTFRALGKNADAITSYKRAIEIEPNNVAAYRNLALVDPGSLDAAQVRELLQRPDLADEDAMYLHFALADYLNAEGSSEEAFTHYETANRMRRKGFNFDSGGHSRYIDRLIATYSRQFFAENTSLGVDSDLPVFIVGMPRSGTTLVEQIAASHPAVFGAGELGYLTTIERQLRGRLQTGEPYPECVRLLDGAMLKTIANEHLENLRDHSRTARRITDKMPDNFLRLGLIGLLFPNARILHCTREPMDTCVSIYCHNFTGSHLYAYDLRELGRYYLDYERLMAHWREVLGPRILEVKYEELVADQETVSRALIAHLGLDWDERCLRFFENERAILTASSSQVRMPVYTRSIGRWRRYEDHLRPLIEILSAK